MPTYEYRCVKCGEDLEAYQSFSDEPLKKHAGCGGKLTKVMSSVGIVLKGSGFYKTDNRASTRGKSREETTSTSAESSPSTGTSGSSGSEARSTDSGTSSTDSAKPTPSGEKRNGSKKSGEKKSALKSA